MSSRWSRIARGARDAWLVVSIALLLLLALEGAYRVAATPLGALRGGSSLPPGPYAGQAWYRTYSYEHETAVDDGLIWQPYVYFGEKPFHGRYINIDSAGSRRTVQAYAPQTTLRDVLVYGGSTLWGTGQRDSMTIPSRLAADLADAGVRDLRITNLGFSGRIFTQEAIDLMLRLRAGARPSVVIFYDGINDVGAALQDGKAGIPVNEANRTEQFEDWRVLHSRRSDLGTEARVLRRLGAIELARLQFLEALRRRINPPVSLRLPQTDSVTADVARAYLGTVSWVEALARAHGFSAYYFWQPALHSTPKPLSPYERHLSASYETGYGRALVAVHRAVPAILDSAMGRAVPGRFVDLVGMFAGDTTTAYIDDIGHTTEAASAAIAAEMARRLAPRLARR